MYIIPNTVFECNFFFNFSNIHSEWNVFRVFECLFRFILLKSILLKSVIDLITQCVERVESYDNDWHNILILISKTHLVKRATLSVCVKYKCNKTQHRTFTLLNVCNQIRWVFPALFWANITLIKRFFVNIITTKSYLFRLKNIIFQINRIAFIYGPFITHP